MFFKRLILVVIAVLLLLSNINVSASTATPTVTQCVESAGTVLRDKFTSKLRNEEFIYSIYLPPCYATSGETYPVLYLMHGSDSDDQLWIKLGMIDVLDKGIKDGAFAPFVLVLPYGGNIANINTFRPQS